MFVVAQLTSTNALDEQRAINVRHKIHHLHGVTKFVISYINSRVSTPTFSNNILPEYSMCKAKTPRKVF